MRNRVLAVIPGLCFFLFLGFLRIFCRMRKPLGSKPPANAIVYWSHTDIYPQQIDGIFSRDQQFKMALLGSRTLLSYIWYPWHFFRGFFIFRPQLSGPKPFHQISDYLKKNPNLRVGIMTDSGGPYGRVRPTLVGLSLVTNRPLVALKSRASHSIKIKSHHIPLPFSRVWSEFSDPISAEQLRNLGEKEALALVQRRFEDPPNGKKH
jgi:hypothetical protein